MTTDELGDEITTLAAHLHAAMCRLLLLIGEFDERRAWADWGCKSCAHWISWRCSIGPNAAREYVRVARRLRSLPLVCEAFGTGELSYSKVRALSRVENVEREQALLDLARVSTAAQLERVVRGYRGVTRSEAQDTYDGRFLAFDHDDHGGVRVRGRLSREEAAVLERALEAARERADVSAETPNEIPWPADSDAPRQTRSAGERNADALVLLADESLAAARHETRSAGERYEVVVHVDAEALSADEGHAEIAGGEPLAAETARRLCCDASVSALVERDGRAVAGSRRTRTIPAVLRRALRSRDGGCRFPGCTQRQWVDAHHIHHWAHGGETSLGNLVQLCRHHHRLVHEGGYSVERRAGHGLVFRRPDGRTLHAVPRPTRRGDPGCIVADNRRCGSDMTPTTCVPNWHGERLELGNAVEAMIACAPPPKEVDPSPHLGA